MSLVSTDWVEKNITCPKGYESDHFTTKSIIENAQTDINMYKKPN